MTFNSRIAFSALMISGCYIDTSDQTRENTPIRGIHSENEVIALSDDLDAETCHHRGDSGCFDGYLMPKKEFFVEGKNFFNAEDFANRFAELLDTQKLKHNDANDSIDWELMTEVNNQNFFHGFEYLLSGSSVRSGTLMQGGSFRLSNLSPGHYDLRVQKKLRLKAQRRSEQKPSDLPKAENSALSGGDDLVISKDLGDEKFYCAMLYVDAPLEIARKKRSWLSLNDFRMHLFDKDCLDFSGAN